MLRNWKVRALAQKVLWQLPGGVRLNTLVSRLQSGHHPETELFGKHAPHLTRHLRAARQWAALNPQATTVLEIGTGWDFNVALILRSLGFGQVTTIDAFRHVRLDQVRRMLPLMEKAVSQVAEQSGLTADTSRPDWNRLSTANTVDEFCRLAGIHYHAPIDPKYSPVANNSIDLCCSTAVFEHIRPAEVEQILRVLYGKLAPSGLMSHVIDLKDHFAYFQPGLPYNHFLRFSEREWDYWAGNPMTYTNRLSATQWRHLFEQNGYELLVFEEVVETSMPALPPSAIHPSHTHWSPRDLTIGEIHVVARPRK